MYSEDYTKYLQSLHGDADKLYEIANSARAKGFDPKPYVEIPQANDLADRTQKLLSYLAPRNTAEQIRELTKVFDGNRERVAIEIAKKTNSSVTGITLSENQYEHSVKKAKELNLDNQVEFKLLDYRQLTEKFDRIVSVGMFEHVGRKFYSTYFKQVSKLLAEDGVALIHTIGSVNQPRDPQPWITKYIFPGGYTPSLSQLATPIEKSGLVISDMEVLRMHYSHTLRHWKERFLSKKDTVLEMFDEKFMRMWEFYLASCEMAFKWGDQVVFQLQLTKNFTSLPNTRDYIYS